MSMPLVLCYHAISTDWDNSVALRPQQLRAQLSVLAAQGYRALTFTEAVTGAHTGRTVCITFDDGFRSVHFHALPVLREFGFVGTAFVPTAFLSPPRPLSWRGYDDLPVVQGDEMAPMSWGELHELGTAGWEIGSHTRTHPHLLEVEDAVLNDELVRSRTELEAGMGAPATSIAYPYGEVDRRVRDAAAAAGYAAAAALGPQVRRGDPLRWPRVGIYRADNLSRFRLKTTRVMCSAPAAAVINIVRSLQGRA